VVEYLLKVNDMIRTVDVVCILIYVTVRIDPMQCAKKNTRETPVVLS